MKVFFASFGIFPPREYHLKSIGAKRLVSFADPEKVRLLDYYKQPMVKPPRKKPRP